MKINIFKIPLDAVDDLTVDLEENEYTPAADHEDDHAFTCLYLRKKRTSNEGWLAYYHHYLEDQVYKDFSENIGSESVSGVFLICTDHYAYAIAHGQAHFIVRKHCDKDFGLDLAERIMDQKGLKMKHSQTFTSAGRKDITSYLNRKALGDSQEYGEAFSYVKCKTIDKENWGETADFGESVRFTFGQDFDLSPSELNLLTDRIEAVLAVPAVIQLPRYSKVTDQTILERLNADLNQHYTDFLTQVAVDDYWLTGVSFNFSGDYRYSLKFKRLDLTDIQSSIDAKSIYDAIERNKDIIARNYELIRVVFYDENDNRLFSKPLQELLQITVDLDSKYYVLFQSKWVQFNESYIAYIKDQVDSIHYEIKAIAEKREPELIDRLVAQGDYIQLHKDNVYIGKYCIEKADLMDDENVIMIKGQENTPDLVYLIKQATTSLRLADAGEYGENLFAGRNVCLWMLLARKQLSKLSDLKSFHLLDALNDFKRVVTDMNLTPVVWVSLDK